MRIDILFPVYQRHEFAKAALCALDDNTDLKHRARLCLHHDEHNEGPVAVMNRFLAQEDGSAIFAKIDSDTIVPPGWLEAALAVMDENPELGLLGIEPPVSRTPAPWAGGVRMPAPELLLKDVAHHCGYARCDMIGGVGLMRRSAFAGRAPMKPHGPNGVGGFSDWQTRHPEVIKGWIVPPLNVFLLDRLPIEPWASLSRQYVAQGWQRPWTNYSAKDAALWNWWLTQ